MFGEKESVMTDRIIFGVESEEWDADCKQ